MRSLSDACNSRCDRELLFQSVASDGRARPTQTFPPSSQTATVLIGENEVFGNDSLGVFFFSGEFFVCLFLISPVGVTTLRVQWISSLHIYCKYGIKVFLNIVLGGASL